MVTYSFPPRQLGSVSGVCSPIWSETLPSFLRLPTLKPRLDRGEGRCMTKTTAKRWFSRNKVWAATYSPTLEA